jgi:hypothetical protein
MRQRKSITYGARSMGSGSIWGEMIRACLCLIAFVACAPVLYALRPRMTRGTLTAAQRETLTIHARGRQWRETLT